VEATSDDQNDGPIDIPIDEPIDDPIDDPQNDQNDDPIDDQIDEPQNDQNDDPIDDQNEDPIDDPIDDPIEEKIEAPNVGVQPFVVVSSTWYVNLANTSVHLSLDTILPPFVLYSSVVGSNKVVAVSSEVVKVPTTKRRRKEAMSTRITRSKVVARSARTKKKPQRFVDD
jgi:hypothetical protein